jgi:hypothetical protein
MNPRPRPFVILAAAVVDALPAASAQAQWYSSYPSGPNGPSMSPQQPYAVEVAPNTYVIHRPAQPRSKAHARCVDCERPAAERPRRSHADRALIDELAKRHVKTKVIHTTKTVREKPVVIEHERVVHDPSRIIERRHIMEDAPGRGLIRQRREVGTAEVVIQPGGHKLQTERPAKHKHAASGRQSPNARRARPLASASSKPMPRSPFSGPTA